MENKKLFVDARWVAQPGQGVYTYFHEIYSRLLSRNISGFELIFGVLPGKLPDFDLGNSRVVEYQSDSFLWRQYGLGRVINDINPDYVHFQYVLPFGLNGKINKILALHDVIFLDYPEYFSYVHRLTRKIFYGMSAKRANTLLTISGKSAFDIEKYLGVDIDNIKVIPLGSGSRLNLAEEKKNQLLENKNYILSVGRHEPRKNYSRLIIAFMESRLFEDKGVYLVIAGWIAEEFSNSIGEIPPGVLLLTDCNDAELAWLYKNAMGFVFPSIAEGYGLPLVEALEFGLPSITSKNYPIDEVKRLCLSVFNPFSIEEIKNALEDLSRLPKDYAVSTKGIPTWDDYVDQFVSTLQLQKKN